MTLGLMGGMAVMSMLYLFAQSEKEAFLKGYSTYANTILIGNQVLANFSLIFGLTLTMIYYRKQQELPMN